MIRPPGFAGAAFGTAVDGDGRSDPAARAAISAELGVGDGWAWVRQVHGATVREATAPGSQGEGDAIVTLVPGLPVAVATADCYPVALEAEGAVAIVHAGWRGAAAGVVAGAREALLARGEPPGRAAVGPGIGPCCYEVGPDVTGPLAGFTATTTWGTPSVDLRAAIAAQLRGLDVWWSGTCTRCGDGFHSYRRDRTQWRQVALAWLPND